MLPAASLGILSSLLSDVFHSKESTHHSFLYHGYFKVVEAIEANSSTSEAAHADEGAPVMLSHETGLARYNIGKFVLFPLL